MNDLIQNWISKLKNIWFIPAMILVGVVLMVYQADQKTSVPAVLVSQDQQYILDTQERINQMLLSIDGAYPCDVTITLASGVKKEYVREAGKVLVITDDQGNQSAVVSKEIAPEIAGVTVLCRGAGNITLERNIIESISTVLGIGSNKVCVIFSERDGS